MPTKKKVAKEELPLFEYAKEKESASAVSGASAMPQSRPSAATGAAGFQKKEKKKMTPEEGREDKRRAEHAKGEAYKLEQKNRGYMIVYRSTRGWWKMGDLSAAIYVHLVAKRLGRKRKPNILTDGDFYHKFKMGVCSIPDVEIFEKELKRIKIKAIEKNDEYVIFDYGKKFTPKEIDDLMSVSHNQQEMINSIVMHGKMVPEVYHPLIQIQREIMNITKKLPKFEKDIYGRDMAIEARDAVMTYIKMTNDIVSVPEAMTRIISDITMVTFGLQDLTEQGVIEKKRCLQILTLILDAKKVAGVEIKRWKDDQKTSQ